MSASIVQAQYEELERIAARFGQQAEVQIALEQRVQRAVAALESGGWIGRGAAAFMFEMDGTIFPTLQRLISALREAQTVTLEIRTLIQQAEEEAAALFQQTHDTLATATGFQGIVTGVAALIGNFLKGIAADTLLPQRYILRALTPNPARGQTSVAAFMDMLAGRSGRGAWLIRFDGPHSGAPFPHINLNSQLTGFRDPHTAISPSLLKIAGQGAKLLEGARRIALPIAIVTDVFRLGSAFQSDGNQIGSATKQTIGSVAGGWGGAFAGAKLGATGGAALGAAVGSVVPGLGTVAGAGVGGFLGGLAGGVIGAYGGSELGEYIGGLF